MKQITEKQIVEWKAELNVQRQKELEAKQSLEHISKTILMIEGGIQFGEICLQKNESLSQESSTVGLDPQSRKVSSKK